MQKLQYTSGIEFILLTDQSQRKLFAVCTRAVLLNNALMFLSFDNTEKCLTCSALTDGSNCCSSDIDRKRWSRAVYVV